MPHLDAHSLFTAKLNTSVGYRTQFKHATKELDAYLTKHPEYKSHFTQDQLTEIAYHEYKISGYTWHHDGTSANMQLLPTALHNAVLHTGWHGLSKQT